MRVRFSSLIILAGIVSSIVSADELTPDDWKTFRSLEQKYTPRRTIEEIPDAVELLDRVDRDARKVEQGIIPDLEYARAATMAQAGIQDSPGKYAAFKTIVFISHSIPEKTLRQWFRQAAGDKSIGFVLRGAQSDDVGRSLTTLQKMMPGTGPGQQAVVFLDPLLFRTYRVEDVPFFLHRAKDDQWYGLRGEIAIAGARDRIERGQGGRHRDPVGNIYPIAERDLHEVIREKMIAYDWDSSRKRALADIKGMDVHLDLPVAEKDTERSVDMSVRLVRDVRAPDGRLLGSAGDIINPLDRIKLDRVYAVFDPSHPGQAKVAAEWARQYPNIVLLATTLNNWVMESYMPKYPMHFLVPIVRQRFQIERVPALVMQEGNRLKVLEIKPPLVP